MLTNRKYLFLFICLFVSSSTFAQLTQVKRLEFEQKLNSEDENMVIPIAEKGLLHLVISMDNYRNYGNLSFAKYDSTLTQNWTTNFKADVDFELIKTYQNKQLFYVLFKKKEKLDIGVLRINLETGDKAYVDGNLLTELNIEHFLVLQNKALIGGKYNDRPVVVMFSFFDKTSKVLPEIHSNHLLITNLGADENEKTLYLMLKNERTCELVVKKYSYEGKAIQTMSLGGRDFSPISGEILSLSNEKAMLIGNYGEGCSPFAIGFYLKNLFDDSPIQYINFTDLDNFFSYLNPKQEGRMKERVKQKKQKGKNINFRFRLLLHDVIKNNEGWLLIAEVFYPEYKSPSSTYVWNSSLRNYRIGNDVYNNFRFSHAIICSFDQSGKLIWNNSVSLKNIESQELIEKVQLSAENNYQILAYPDDNFIKTVVIQGNEKIKNLENFDLKPNSSNETILDNTNTNVVAWYGHNFLVYGYQQIRKSDFLSHNVFFINKLNYTLKEKTIEKK